MRRLLLVSLVMFLLIITASALDINYYDLDSDITTEWDEGTGVTYLEIDNQIRQPNNNTDDYIASRANDHDESEFGFTPFLGTPSYVTYGFIQKQVQMQNILLNYKEQVKMYVK